MTARDAAMRLLNAPRDEWYRDGESSWIDVAVGHVLGTDPDSDVLDVVRARMATVSMPAVATGVVLARPHARPLIDDCLAAMPPEHRRYALRNLDGLLARVDLEWAWSVVRDTVYERGWCGVTALSASVLGAADGPLPPTFDKPLVPLRLVARLWNGDLGARDEIVNGIGDGQWRSIGSSQQIAWLAAGVVVDPDFVLDQLVAHPEVYDTQDILAVLELAAAALVKAGRGERYVDAIPVDGNGDPDPHWLAAAIEQGLFTSRARARERVAAAIRRVEDASDSDDRVAVIGALASLGDGAAVVDLAKRWHIAPTLVVVSVMFAGDGEVASRIIEGDSLEKLFASSRGEWEPEGRDWWYDVRENEADLVAACRDVAALAGNILWRDAPDGIASVLAMIRAGIEREQH